MCALVCALHRDRRGHLPHSRMELYQAALSMLLVRRDRERSIDVPEGIQLTEHQPHVFSCGGDLTSRQKKGASHLR
jgi:hypothetical protein